MSPLNRGGPLLGTRMTAMPFAGMRPPPPRFGGRLPSPGIPPMRMPPHSPPMGRMFPPMPMRPMPPMRQRMPPPRSGTIMRPGGPPPMFGPRIGCGPPMRPPMMGPRGLRGPLLRPGPRGMPPHMLMRPKFSQGNNAIRSKGNNAKKANKLEDSELKKPWMTDAIRSEIQRKNKLYAKAKKSKDGKEWEEFKDLRNKVTRMIRDAKNDSEKNSDKKEATSPVQKVTSIQESAELEKVQESTNNEVQCEETVQVAVAVQN